LVGCIDSFHNKREVRVYDYADLNVPMLARMFDAPLSPLRRYRLHDSASRKLGAGWPADVPLPVDPDWKSQYAASVRRLVRDGVDSPLAKLFVHAAVIPPSDTDSSDRARSATEAFLYRRLETLAETAGEVSLECRAADSVRWLGPMEVDLLCEPSHIAVELDGRQHLGDPEAYRRDRRKDALLQENGYRVLRFLAEDVGKCLDQVLERYPASLSAPKHQNLSDD